MAYVTPSVRATKRQFSCARRSQQIKSRKLLTEIPLKNAVHLKVTV